MSWFALGWVLQVARGCPQHAMTREHQGMMFNKTGLGWPLAARRAPLRIASATVLAAALLIGGVAGTPSARAATQPTLLPALGQFVSVPITDAQGGVDNLARWTSHGPWWLRPADHPREQIHGASPDIRDDGAIVYETPPGPGDRDFAVWFQRGFSGTARIIYRRRIDVGNPLFGPHDQIALWGPVGPYLSGHKPQVVILSGLAHPRTLPTGYSELGNPALWNEHAPALEVPSLHDGAKLFFPDGRQESLPSGWQPLAWNPAGSAMLLQNGSDLGIWTLKAGHEVTMLGPISHGFQISQVSWLSSPARL